MRSLPFHEFGPRRLDAIARPGMVCAFDFDGTLAPIVKEPARAAVPVAILRRLHALSEFARVAIFSGRTVEDVGARLDFVPDFVIGNHGAEGCSGTAVRAHTYSRLCDEWMHLLQWALKEQDRFDPAIWIEHKAYSLSVHYRFARNREQAAAELRRLFPVLMPHARIVPGDCVFNLLPGDAPGKAAVLEQVCHASGARSALYVGGDAIGEDLFQVQRDDWLTVRVERGSGLASDSGAALYLNHRLDIVQLLDALIRRLRYGAVPLR